jgi:hypothetical protein
MANDLKNENMHFNINDVVEQCCAYFDGHQQFSEALLQAKDKFFQITGKVSESNRNFTLRMNTFLHWFAFDWELESIRLTPYEVYVKTLRGKVDASEFKILEEQINHVHSLFKFIKITKNGFTVIKDILNGQRYLVFDQNALFGVDKGTFFETRLYQVDSGFIFANYFVFHPLVVRRGIKKNIRLIRKQRKPLLPFLLRLQSYNYKWHKYRSIDIKSIYHFDDSYPEAK